MPSPKRENNVYAYDGFQETIIILLTLKCPLVCTHCIVNSSPQRQEEIPTEVALDWVRQIGEYRKIKVIGFTGGEPFLNKKRLRSVIALASQYGILTSVVTSCYWAANVDHAVMILRDLPGLTNITLSCDKYHLDFVPLDYVKNVALAALSCGIDVGAFFTLENEEDPFLVRFQKFMGDSLYKRLKRVIPRYVHPAGRGEQLRDKVTFVPFSELPDQPCHASATPTILTNGNVTVCCGDIAHNSKHSKSLTIGNLYHESLQAVLERADKKNFLIHALRLLGPKGLAKIAIEKGLGDYFKGHYEKNSICGICRGVMTNDSVYNVVSEELRNPKLQKFISLRRTLAFREVPMMVENWTNSKPM